MIATLKKYIGRHLPNTQVKEHGVVEAYDIWAENYDSQPGNLMLDLDEVLFSKLVTGDLIDSRKVVDIGCGTGRHWKKLFAKKPAALTGFDVSPGMLNKLTAKFPEAQTHVIFDDAFSGIRDASFDTIISTLTVAHIEHIETALTAWARILKRQSDIIVTDFHPAVLATGGQRTFKHNNGHIAVRNFVHATSAIKSILGKLGFVIVAEEEIRIDEAVKHYYSDQNALHVYEKFKGLPVIYGMHFRRAL